MKTTNNFNGDVVFKDEARRRGSVMDLSHQDMVRKHNASRKHVFYYESDKDDVVCHVEDTPTWKLLLWVAIAVTAFLYFGGR